MLEYARMNLEIAHSREPTAALDVTPETVHRSKGYKHLRSFFVRLSPGKRERFRRMLRAEITGVRDVMALAKRTGEPLQMGDITFDMRDAESGVRLEPPNPEPDKEI